MRMKALMIVAGILAAAECASVGKDNAEQEILDRLLTIIRKGTRQ
jgi:hypothetical protein